MSNRSWVLWTVSLLALLLWLAFELVRGDRRAALNALRSRYGWVLVLLLIVSAAIAAAAAYQPIELKSSDSKPVSWGMVGLLYGAMVLGMIAQAYFFAGTASAMSPDSFIKPVLASPIVFIPLVSSYQTNLLSSAPFALSDLMIMLVAFQNGFFWKVVFDKASEMTKKPVSNS